jgi:JAB domain-containing protein similar to deubiquitination enzymes
MSVAGLRFRTRVKRVAIAAACLVALLVLRPQAARLVQAAWPLAGAAGAGGAAGQGTIAHTLILSDQARRYLALQYRSYPTEFMGCMIGEVRGNTVVVRRIAPADVDPAHSTPTHVRPKESCEQAGWLGTVGMIHSHPGGQNCWYYFPTTSVLASDGQSFMRQPYPVDAIMCGDRVVWISRDMAEKQLRTGGGPAGDRTASSATSER